jgi:hypothetical protein
MPAGVTAPTRRRRGLARGAALLVLAAIAPLTATFASGAADSFPRARLLTDAQRAQAPDWTLPCWAIAPYNGHPACLRVSGRVVWRQTHDPDGDGDRHLLVAARFGLHVVEVPKGLPLRLPRLGAHVEAIGWQTRGASGRRELQAIRVVTGGTGHWGPPG